MSRTFAISLAAAVLLLIAGCSDNKITNLANQPPVITALSVNPEQAYLGELVTVSSAARDPEGGGLGYHWSATFGYFTGTGPKVNYHTEGCCLGLNEITLTVTDTNGDFSQRKIWVNIEK